MCAESTLCYGVGRMVLVAWSADIDAVFFFFFFVLFFFLMIRRPPISTQSRSSAASDVYKRQLLAFMHFLAPIISRFNRFSYYFLLPA